MKPFFSIKNLSLFGLLATAINSLYPLAAHGLPVVAIDNQATGTYEDPRFPRTPLTVTSEKVTVALQEVAGISLNPTGITRQDGSLNGGAVGTPVKDTVLFYNFEVQNIGTDPTFFSIPNLATVGALGTFQKVQYFDGNLWKDVPSNGYISPAMAINTKLFVRVVVKVQDGVGTLVVSLGNSPNNGQNQPRSAQPNDVFTIDPPDQTPGEFAGPPLNGVREAQATQSLPIGAPPIALTQIDLKIDSPFNPYNNRIGYGLGLKVLDSLPPNFTNITPTDLTGRPITLDNRLQTGILITNAIPLGSKFSAATTPSTEWIIVYDYGTSPIGPNDRADTIPWSTTAPNASTANQVRRVGFFRRNYRMPKGTTLTGFRVEIEITDFSLNKIYNMAQVFGSHPAEPNNISNITPSTQLVYDESGDSLPNNYNYDGTPGTLNNDGTPTVYPGIVDPTVPDSDPRSPVRTDEAKGSSSLTSPDGEYIVVPFQVAPAPTLKNGPKDQPRAVGPTNDNDDFTNKSVAIKGNMPFDPVVLPFVNTIINTGTLTRDIRVVPKVDQATDLPEGTVVTLKDPVTEATAATFKYQNGVFVPIAESPASLVLPGVVANGTKNYSVFVDLPANTPVLKAFPLRLVAFIDANGNNQPDPQEGQNSTIDRTYTGFLQVIKESRVLAFDRTPIPGTIGVFSESTKPVKLDQFIEYRITYRNISTPAIGNGNQTISATNFTIIEDGRVSPNNWANLTVNDPNSATSSNPSNITYSTATAESVTTDPEVVKYENVLTGSVDPGQSGTFTFRRKVK